MKKIGISFTFLQNISQSATDQVLHNVHKRYFCISFLPSGHFWDVCVLDRCVGSEPAASSDSHRRVCVTKMSFEPQWNVSFFRVQIDPKLYIKTNIIYGGFMWWIFWDWSEIIWWENKYEPNQRSEQIHSLFTMGPGVWQQETEDTSDKLYSCPKLFWEMRVILDWLERYVFNSQSANVLLLKLLQELSFSGKSLNLTWIIKNKF